MDCNNVQNELLTTGGNAGIEAQSHLAQCEECRKFAVVLALSVRFANDAADQATRNACLREIRRNRALSKICAFLKTFNYVAAAVLLCLGIWQFMPSGEMAVAHEAAVAFSAAEVPQIHIGQPEENEGSWRRRINTWNSELDLMDDNLTLLACGF